MLWRCRTITPSRLTLWSSACRLASTAGIPDFTSKDPLRVLGLSAGSNPDQIKEQYYRLAKMYHPDINGGDETVFKQVQAAYLQACKNLNTDAKPFTPEGAWGAARSQSSWSSQTKAPEGHEVPDRREAERVQYLQIQEWWVLSATFRTTDDAQMFEQVLHKWAVLSLFERAVALALVGQTDLLFLCDEDEKQFWVKKVDEQWQEWDACWARVQGWAQTHREALEARRADIEFDEIVTLKRQFGTRFGAKSMRARAMEEFEELKMDLMTKRSAAQSAEDEW